LTLRAHEDAMSGILARMMPSIRDLTLDELAALCKAYPGMPAGRAGNAVISALDQACLDLAGQYLGQPICDLWGQADHTPLRSYGTVNRSVSQRTPAGFAEACKAATAAGFQGIKIMPFDAVTPRTASSAEGQAEVARAVQRIQAVRDSTATGASMATPPAASSTPCRTRACTGSNAPYRSPPNGMTASARCASMPTVPAYDWPAPRTSSARPAPCLS
jgi:L-alanine-DL-glutamate epimerase-like enolase superfamily enzyme